MLLMDPVSKSNSNSQDLRLNSGGTVVFQSGENNPSMDLLREAQKEFVIWAESTTEILVCHGND